MRFLSVHKPEELLESTFRLMATRRPLPQRLWPLLPGIDASLLTDKSSSIAIADFLKAMFDEWFECGRSLIPEGTEVEARGQGTPGADLEWTYTLRPQRWGIITGKPADGPIDMTTLPAASWLWRVVADWCRRFQGAVLFTPTGHFYVTRALGFELSELGFVPPHLNVGRNLKAWDTAIFWFISLIDSDAEPLMERCGYCSKFFLRERRPARTLKRTPVCGECKSTAAAKRKDAVRKAHTARQLASAAEASLRWNSKRNGANRKLFIAKEVSSLYPRDKPLTVRWVTQHEEEITALLNGRAA